MSDKAARKYKEDFDKFTANLIEDLALSEEEVRDVLGHIGRTVRHHLFNVGSSVRPEPQPTKRQSSFGDNLPEIDDLEDGVLTLPSSLGESKNARKQNTPKSTSVAKPGTGKVKSKAEASQPKKAGSSKATAVKASPAREGRKQPSVPGRVGLRGTAAVVESGKKNVATQPAPSKAAKAPSKTAATKQPSVTDKASSAKEGTRKQAASRTVKTT